MSKKSPFHLGPALLVLFSFYFVSAAMTNIPAAKSPESLSQEIRIAKNAIIVERCLSTK